jgi:hypothetical protein
MTCFFHLALDAMGRQNLAVKFLKAQAWNDKLDGFIVIFETRRRELQLALQMSTAMQVNELAQEYVLTCRLFILHRILTVLIFHHQRQGNEADDDDDARRYAGPTRELKAVRAVRCP